ncbi:pro-epidermal growth factor [Plakobranchus ocellatus]|uniref:Pro-epidermal growth factor n=1 Tax=Plakobranchus ocellatus TaxID=259542 RepID=A0AAV4B9N0_9GAST|nr:pro-epidermal growth factor [Plakobranchus ocellatus]
MDGLATWLGPGKVSDILAAVTDRDLWRDMIANAYKQGLMMMVIYLSIYPAAANPCLPTNGGCADFCVPRVNHVTCLCAEGFLLLPDRTSCIREDIHEVVPKAALSSTPESLEASTVRDLTLRRSSQSPNDSAFPSTFHGFSDKQTTASSTQFSSKSISADLPKEEDDRKAGQRSQHVPESTISEAFPKSTSLEAVPQSTTSVAAPKSTTSVAAPKSTTSVTALKPTTSTAIPQFTPLVAFSKSTTSMSLPMSTTSAGDIDTKSTTSTAAPQSTSLSAVLQSTILLVATESTTSSSVTGSNISASSTQDSTCDIVCQNNSTCVETDGLYSCLCEQGYTGKFCHQGPEKSPGKSTNTGSNSTGWIAGVITAVILLVLIAGLVYGYRVKRRRQVCNIFLAFLVQTMESMVSVTKG